jgi:hypothetical protein
MSRGRGGPIRLNCRHEPRTKTADRRPLHRPVPVFPYRLDHRHFDESKELDGWSYLLASLFGPFYVMAHRFYGLAALMFLASAVIGGLATVTLLYLLLFFESVAFRTLAIFAVPLVALLIQGLVAIEIVLVGYLRRGWREGY